MDILYTVGNGLYINITNRCCCDCVFCVRRGQSGVGSADNLWLSSEPEADEVIGLLEKEPLGQYDEIVFCGFGEPTERLDVLIKICGYLKKKTATPVRLNTNGLSDMINSIITPPMFEGLLDTVSVSLNAPNAERYAEISRPRFGIGSFDIMLKFIADCKKYVPDTVLTIVDILSPEETAQCQKLAEKLKVPLRVRSCY